MSHCSPLSPATFGTLLLACVGALAAPALSLAQDKPAPAAAPTTLLLGAREPAPVTLAPEGGLLIREIMRQAVLLAAREELHLATRDAALREFTPDGDQPAGFIDIRTEAVRDKRFAFTLERGSADKPEVLWRKELALPTGSGLNYLQLVEFMERVARTDLPGVLGRAGFKSDAKRGAAEAGLSKAAEANLGRMTFPCQFAALRELHGLIQAGKETPAALGGLVRGYANLGQLTAHHWNAGHKVFKARALLYAERMVAAEPKSADAHWHRAYARALAGLSAAALDSLAEAKKLTADGKGEGEPPWVWTVDAYSKLDAERLLEKASDAAATKELAPFLAFVTLELQGRNAAFIAFTARTARAMPETHRLYDSLYRTGQLDAGHFVNQTGPASLLSFFGKRLADMQGLPAGVRDKLGDKPAELEPAALAGIFKALRAEGQPDKDRQDPSWAALARLAEDTAFVQAWQCSEFARRKLGLPLDDVKEATRELLPLVADHPYNDFLLTYAIDERRQPGVYVSLLKNLNLVDVELTAEAALAATLNINTPGKVQGREGLKMAEVHADTTSDDLHRLFGYAKADARLIYARQLQAVSPHSSAPVVVLITTDWPAAKDRAAAWEKEFARRAPVQWALGKRYSQLKQYADAERCLRAYLKMSPDINAYVLLANNYKAQDDLARWQATLDEFLQTPAVGLGHAQVQVEVARHFMSKRQFDKAKPYADAAAETWAAWAMLCAADCDEGLKDWEASEKWVRNVAERYENTQTSWFFWCVRTGKGDREVARKLAAFRVEGQRANKDRDALLAAFVYYTCVQKPDEAYRVCQTQLALRPGEIYFGMHAALLADELGKTKDRDDILRRFADMAAKRQPPDPTAAPVPGQTLGWALEDLASVFLAAVSEKGAALDLKRMEAAMAKCTRADQGIARYYVGRFLDLHGKSEDAERYLQASAASAARTTPTPILAAHRLQTRGAKDPPK